MTKTYFYGLLALAVALVSSCSVATPYKKNGIAGGYEDMLLANGNYQVAFYGNGNSEPYDIKRKA